MAVMALAKLGADEQEGHMRPVRQVSEPSITKLRILRAEVNDTVVQKKSGVRKIRGVDLALTIYLFIPLSITTLSGNVVSVLYSLLSNSQALSNN